MAYVLCPVGAVMLLFAYFALKEGGGLLWDLHVRRNLESLLVKHYGDSRSATVKAVIAVLVAALLGAGGAILIILPFTRYLP